MPVQAISTPTIIVNNEIVKIKPNSFKYTEGFGEYKKQTQSAGGGQVETVSSKDVSTAFSKFSFTLVPTADNADLVRAWKNKFNNNAVQAVDNVSGFTRTFTSAQLMNDPEITLSADGEISLDWESSPAS